MTKHVEPPVVGHLSDGYATIDVETRYAPPVGVNTLVVEATDVAGNTATTGPIHLVVYDPAAGFAIGGGWFWSGKGNLKGDPKSEGEATLCPRPKGDRAVSKGKGR